MPPRRPEQSGSLRPPNAGGGLSSYSRPRMYNLAGHAHSSGSLLPRSTENVAQSSSAAAGAATMGVSATEAPYLTNLESHFGRVTLTAPDNMRRKQAKEKKQKTRQRKAQTAQAAAAALAGISPSSPASAVRDAATTSSSGLLDPGRRYQAAMDDGSLSSGLSVRPAQPGMRRAYSGNQTETLASTQPSASTSHANASAISASNTTSLSARRRRASNAREDSSRPASRASGVSRPSSSASHTPLSTSERFGTHDADSTPQRQSDDRASLAQGNGAFESPTIQSHATSQPHTSLHRQNVWNDITEPDPDDLPPPFPEGASRPPDPVQPPPHSLASSDQQLIAPQPHQRVPDSPPPPFRSDPESEADEPARDPSSRITTSPPFAHDSVSTGQHTSGASCSPRPRRASASRISIVSASATESSASDGESVEATEERRAWEADIQAGLSFDVRVLREQQRRVARERALLVAARASRRSSASSINSPHPDSEAAVAVPPDSGPLGAAVPSIRLDDADQADDEAGSLDGERDAAFHGEGEATAQNRLGAENISATASDALDTLFTETSNEPPTAIDPVVSTDDAAADADVGLTHATVPLASAVTSSPVPHASNTVSIATTAPASQVPEQARAQSPQLETTVATSIRSTTSPTRQALFNEARLGLPSTLASAAATPADQRRIPARRNVHRKTNSDSRSQPRVSSWAASQNRPMSQGARLTPASTARTRILSEGGTVRGHDSDSHLPLPGRPEDTLFVVSAPPPAIKPNSSTSNLDPPSGPRDLLHARMQSNTMDNVSDGTDSEAASDDGGAESDSSMEQWLAEAAAFDALRRKEEEAAKRLEALRASPVSDSDVEEDTERHNDASMPGGFKTRRRSARLSSSPRDASRPNIPDPADLARMDRVLPKAPPPLVLGRSRGGAAYSDSSSDSTDTDEALDQYSSSEEDEQAYEEAITGDESTGAAVSIAGPVLGSKASTTSEPDLTGVHKLPPLPPRPSINEASQNTALLRGEVAHSRPISLPPAQIVGVNTGQPEQLARSLSLKAQGKLPERQISVQARTSGSQPAGVDTITASISLRAGDFEEDTASSRDLEDSDSDPAVAPAQPTSIVKPNDGVIEKRDLLRRSESDDTQRVLAEALRENLTTVEAARLSASAGSLSIGMGGISRASLEPLLQPLSSGRPRPELGSRLKDLFGQPLIATADASTSVSDTPRCKLSAGSTSPIATVAEEGPSPVKSKNQSLQRQGSSQSSKAPPRSLKPERASLDRKGSLPDRQIYSQAASQPPQPPQSLSQSSQRSSSALSGSLLERDSGVNQEQQFATDRPTVVRRASASSRAGTDATPEQQAREAALSQIAQLNSTSSARQDSLAALERLLARTGRPVTSAIPASDHRFSVQGPRQLSADVGTSSRDEVSETIVAETSRSSADRASVRLSRAGAITRGKAVAGSDSGSARIGPVVPPITYRTTGSTRPVSFVNPRSSAAPLPRGRLPAITDATRHFPPSSPSSTPTPTPSWLAYIPSEDRHRLPAPLEPDRSASGQRPSALTENSSGAASEARSTPPLRVPVSKVSQMITRFEGASQDSSSSPAKSSNAAGLTNGDVDAASIHRSAPSSALSTLLDDSRQAFSHVVTHSDEPAVFGRFDRFDNSHSSVRAEIPRREPPPPPSQRASQRVDLNPFRQSTSSQSAGVLNAAGSAAPSVSSTRPISGVSNRPVSGMDTLSLQIDEAASAWSQPVRYSVNSPMLPQATSNASPLLTVPAITAEPLGTAPGPSGRSSGLSRSPRTLAMDALTGRQNDLSPSTPPQLPSKSPLMTPERIVAESSRNGLSASIAAAQAAALARREHREGRSNSGSGSFNDADSSRHQDSSKLPRGSESTVNGLFGPTSIFSSTLERSAEQAGSRSSPVPASSSRPLPTLPPSIRSASGSRLNGAVGHTFAEGTESSANLGPSSRRLPMPPPLPNRPRSRNWLESAYSQPVRQEAVQVLGSAQPTEQRALPLIPPGSPATSATWRHQAADIDGRSDVASVAAPSTHRVTPSDERNRAGFGLTSRHAGGMPPSTSFDEPDSNSTSRLESRPAVADAEASSSAESESSEVGSSGRAGGSGQQGAPRREASLGITDFDLLVAQLEREGSHFEQLSAIGEFLGPAKRVSATEEQLASLSVGKVECDSRRVTREGKVKHKLSCVGVRIDKCNICLAQFRENQLAAILPCLHIFHEDCARQLFRRVNTCPTCRQPAF
ncbi:hypothetical protein BCV70DRAFT_200266 [Testicularia cyperi]|uniref:RING-type domain-containing protein n=1 Tax=Testicularia cyperi TaxID=1882483 RepID=A0A317XPQ9_9BASI|nr:hypothetical protein BCV70DRAFT_200266 [Testicularia cyperi]